VTPFRITDTRTGSGQPNAGMTPSAAATLPVQSHRARHRTCRSIGGGAQRDRVDPTALRVPDCLPRGGDPDADGLQPQLHARRYSGEPRHCTAEFYGGVSIFNHAGSTNVVVDVEGYYTSTPSPMAAVSTTRSPRCVLLAPSSTVPWSRRTRSVPVTVTGTLTGVPANATAVVANVTASFGTNPSFLTVYPAGATMPLASNLNFGANQVVPNRVTVGVGTVGQNRGLQPLRYGERRR